MCIISSDLLGRKVCECQEVGALPCGTHCVCRTYARERYECAAATAACTCMVDVQRETMPVLRLMFHLLNV